MSPGKLIHNFHPREPEKCRRVWITKCTNHVKGNISDLFLMVQRRQRKQLAFARSTRCRHRDRQPVPSCRRGLLGRSASFPRELARLGEQQVESNEVVSGEREAEGQLSFLEGTRAVTRHTDPSGNCSGHPAQNIAARSLDERGHDGHEPNTQRLNWVTGMVFLEELSLMSRCRCGRPLDQTSSRCDCRDARYLGLHGCRYPTF